MVENDSGNLNADRKRQAIHTLKGFSYQIWQSVYKWVNLKDGEVLFLEGAEDIDFHGPERTETIQVKETQGSGPVTLQTSDVLEAIGHFWEHQKNNPAVTVTFRFLTTAERGHERSRHFGALRGLDYWESCRYPNTDPALIRSFLLGQTILLDGLRAFLASCSDDELRQQLIRRIEWDTGNKPQPFIEELVNDKVAAYGDRVYSLPPSESIRIVPHLLKQAWDTVLKEEDRWLSYRGFMEVFQQVATETVSKQELNFLRSSLTQSLLANEASTGHTSRTYSRPLSESIFEPVSSPLNDKLVLRPALVSRLHTQLNNTGILVLKGSTGMGKSTLSNAVANLDGTSWRKLDMRGRAPEQIYDLLLFASRTIEDQAVEVNCIIDDLNFDKHPTLYEAALAKFIYSVILRTGRIVITTQGALPPFVITQNDVPDESLFDVPALDESEIQQLLHNYGCPGGDNLTEWGRTIFLSTSGHPLLAHARVKKIQSQGWPSPTPEDFSTTRGIEDVRREIRRRLQEQLPFEDARTLAYRLSVLTQRFRRGHALHVGQHPPGLRMPGEAFDSLVGPWVERVDEEHFRLSPLLDGAAVEVFTEQEVKALHKTSAAAFLTRRIVTPGELGAVLFHGLLGEAQKELRTALALSHRVEEEDWPEFCRIIDWLGYFKLQPGEQLFAPDAFLNLWLRRLQFMVTAETDGKRALRVAKVWEREIEEWDGQTQHHITKESMQFSFLNTAIASGQVPFPVKTIVNYVGKIFVLLQDVKSVFPDAPSNDEIFDSKITEIIANFGNYIRAAVLRCKQAEDVIEFLVAWDELEAEAANEAWNLLRRDDYFATMLMDRSWLSEAKSPSPDWMRLIGIFEQAAELGLKRETVSLTVAAYRAKAIVQEEYLKDTDGALQTLAEAETEIGHQHLILQDYRAKIYFIEKNYADSLAIWERILPQLEQEQNPARTFSYRDAEISAALLGDWRKAAEFARGGESAALQSLMMVVPGGMKPEHVSVIAVGFRADYAFALWKSGDKEMAIAVFAEVLNALETLPDPNRNIRSYMLIKLVGHGISWLTHDIRGETDYQEPHPACFSSQEIVEEIKEYPLPPHVFLWYLLAKLEYALNCGDAIFKRFEEEHHKDRVADSQVGYGDLRVRHALKNGELEHLISLLLKWLSDVRDYSAKQNIERDTLSDLSVVIGLLFAALIKLLGSGSRQPIPLNEWRHDAEKWGLLNGPLGEWFDFIEKHLGAESFELAKILKDGSAAIEARLVAALLLSVNDSVSVEDRFYANVVLVTTNVYESWHNETEEIVASIVSTSWLEVTESQRSSLRAPSINAEPIISACKDGSCRGFKKAARVLLAAKNAVWCSVAQDIFSDLKEKAS